MSTDTLKSPERRRFFTNLAVAGGATALLASGGKAMGGDGKPDAPRSARGYRLTEHVKAYYGTLRI